MSAHAIPANAAHEEPTILDTADRLAQLKLPALTLAHDLHIFPVTKPPLEQLRTIAQDAFSIAMSLQQHQSLVLTSKTVSGLKQQTTQARMLKQVRITTTRGVTRVGRSLSLPVDIQCSGRHATSSA